MTPKMHGHGGGAAAENTDNVVFDRLDGLLGHIPSMIVRGDQFIGHCSEVDFRLVRTGCLVVQDLMLWGDAASGHASQCTASGKDEFPFNVVLESLQP